MATTPKAKSPVQRMLDESMIEAVLMGDIWQEDEETIADVQATLAIVVTALKSVGKHFDQNLVDQRKIQGSDYLPSVKHFRKPRETKEGENTENPLLSVFSV